MDNIKHVQSMMALDEIFISDHARTWLFDLNDYSEHINIIESCLSAAERERGQQIKIEKNRRLYALRKGITRLFFSHYLDLKPGDVDYGYSPNKKPYLLNAKTVRFNISHSKNYLLIGIAFKKEIGVDIEIVKKEFHDELLKNSLCSLEELKVFHDYEEKNLSFYKIWTQKEAISKAFGLGIAFGFNEFSVSGNPLLEQEKYVVDIKNETCFIETSYKNGLYMAVAIIQEQVREDDDSVFKINF